MFTLWVTPSESFGRQHLSNFSKIGQLLGKMGNFGASFYKFLSNLWKGQVILVRLCHDLRGVCLFIQLLGYSAPSRGFSREISWVASVRESLEFSWAIGWERKIVGCWLVEEAAGGKVPWTFLKEEQKHSSYPQVQFPDFLLSQGSV